MSKKSYYSIDCPHCGEKIYDDECCDLSHLIDECYDDGWEDSKRAIEKQRLEEGDGKILTEIEKVIEQYLYGYGLDIKTAFEQIIEITKRRNHVAS